MTGLFSPYSAGVLNLQHRIVLPPLTRCRSEQPGNIPGELMCEYYTQRASKGGLLISEGSQISSVAQGIPRTPGIHATEQVVGWKQITDSVHKKGGVIFLQLWHTGRISHSSLHPEQGLPVAPSSIATDGRTKTSQGEAVAFETPRAMSIDDIRETISNYADAASNALLAGFDGVEIHAANGYLIEQFMQSRSNIRRDLYGGSIENRLRFLAEVTEAVIKVCGKERTGVRLSPFGVANRSGEDDPMPLYSEAVKLLDGLGATYIHLIEPRSSGAGQSEVLRAGVPSAAELFRPLWSRTLISAGGYNKGLAESAIESGSADLIAFGRLFISNPDLPERIKNGSELTPYNRDTFYTEGPMGYTDY